MPPDLLATVQGKSTAAAYCVLSCGAGALAPLTGNQVRISGFEEWKIGSDGLIADSTGHYDVHDWDRQVNRR
jgi:hypothetical protein